MIQLVEAVRSRPDAVFVRAYPYRTFRAIKENRGFYRGGADIIRDLFEEGTHAWKELILKPNIVSGRPRDLARSRNYHGGIVTNPQFIAGMLDELHARGETNITIAEGGVGQGIRGFGENGYFDMMAENVVEVPYRSNRDERGARLVWLSKSRFEDYREDELTWVPVPNGVIHRAFPVVAPVRKPGTALINVPTLKTHNLGVTTLCCKGLQGLIAVGHKHFCAPVQPGPSRHSPPSLTDHLHPDFLERVKAEYERHRAQGLPFWDAAADPTHGIGRFEMWGQRAADAVSAFTPFAEHFLLNVVEGIIGRDGTAFSQGHDVPVGLVVAGINPVHVDAVASYLMGHDPRYVPALVICHDRGLGENEIHKIPVFSLPHFQPLQVKDLDRLVVPLPVFLFGQPEPLLFNDRFLSQRALAKAA